MSAESRVRVLVVEDDGSIRHPLQKFLEMHHFEVATADTADRALDAIAHFRPMAAVVDLRLARGSGRDVVVSMPQGAPVIIFSGVPAESADLERIRPHTRLIAKPFSLIMLVETLEEMLALNGRKT